MSQLTSRLLKGSASTFLRNNPSMLGVRHFHSTLPNAGARWDDKQIQSNTTTTTTTTAGSNYHLSLKRF
ncbi:hypothetical protein PPL_06884 [Heterostelium album PN500]|uniref:Uncharacterized protein n=1 Tax=Heterostelium pallidum (strain ATCC 26659 / Pp 5 / PN500) TaxID=670386 RepID=D3BDT1_HETP5|nr:hypothetical protein PPL_06884 [Heterostelium album PN500]EFA80062.1 hypothetical protein PPL_06884 [Heterostelium album PN500]|eukprot:XP_020432182.1 hypothetical protein PPL_06884 [Heterostelium album PN500]